jgi:hypothetical protein
LEDVEPVIRLLDKKFGNTTKFGSKLTVKERFYEVGLVYEDWDGSSRAAHNRKIRTWLEQGRIRISRRCKNMDKALMRHRHLDPTSARAKDEKGVREDVEEKYRHQIDVLAAAVEAADGGVLNSGVVDLRTGEAVKTPAWGAFADDGSWVDDELEGERATAVRNFFNDEVVMPEMERDEVSNKGFFIF